MYAIINAGQRVIGLVDYPPNLDDLDQRGEVPILLGGQQAPQIGDRYDPLNQQFTTPEMPISALYLGQRAALRNACEQAIESGIVHDALGAPHSYPTGRDDQNHLAALGLKAERAERLGEPWSAKYWCADDTKTWARRPHNAAQIISLGEAVMAHVQAQQDRYETKLFELEAAYQNADRVAMRGVVW